MDCLEKNVERIYKKRRMNQSHSFPVEIKTKTKRVFMLMNSTNLPSSLLGILYPL
jgi:hypothetical protein